VEAERSLDELSVANEKLRVDIEKWTDAKDKELGGAMTDWANNNVNYHNKVGRGREGGREGGGLGL